MTWLFTLLAMAVIALVAGVVTGRIAGSMEPPATSLPFRGLPPDGVVPGDLAELRFDAALRGYRMDEVDQVIDRLGEELQRRDDEIAALRAALAEAQSPLPAPDRAGGSPGEGSLVQGSLDPGPLDPGPLDPAYAPPTGGFDLPGWSGPERG